MMIKKIRDNLVLRFVISLLIAMVFGWMISEAAFFVLGENLNRSPGRIEIIIPKGTAQQIDAGQPIESLPDKMTFIEGDELVIINQDIVSHQLGPIWVPPGTAGSMKLEKPNTYTLACSFAPENYFGLDVRQRVTAWVRIQAILAIGAPTGVILALYSLVVFPQSKSAEAV